MLQRRKIHKRDTNKQDTQGEQNESTRFETIRNESNRIGNCSNRPFAIIMKHYSVYSNFVNFMIVCVLTVVLYSQMFPNVQMYSQQQKSSIIPIAARTHAHTHTNNTSTSKVNQQYEMLSLGQFISHSHTQWYIFFNGPTWFAWKMKCLLFFCFKNEWGEGVNGYLWQQFLFSNRHLMRPLPLIKHSKVHLQNVIYTYLFHHDQTRYSSV